MSNDLAPVWDQVVKLLDDNISVIPVRNKDEYYNGKLYARKTPYESWDRWRNEIITQEALFNLMLKHDTTAVAMVCGRISGNLIVIDVDVKYNAGIAILLFNALKDFYPELLERLRVHKTPSGGYHIIYRIEQGAPVPGSCNLAERPATEQEMAENTKNKSKKRCFIECKAEGGLCTAPPSMGYSIRKDVPIPVFTSQEHTQIFELCKSFNEVFEIEKPFKVSPSENNYYSENPFEHYNRTCDPVELLETYGWTCLKKSGKFRWFTKPGGRKGEVHASFDTEKYCYRVFTTNCDLEEKFYLPATILAFYAFSNDKAQTYQHLVNRGYGRIKPAKEADIARRKAMQGLPMPANASPHAQQLYEQQVANINSAYPHGIFWEQDDDDEWKISRERLYDVAYALGFRIYMQDIVQVIDKFIYKRTEGFFYDCLKEYINDEDPIKLEDIQNCYESFLQRSGKFTISRLRELEVDKILCDTRNTCYKYYLNGVVEINKNGYELKEYDSFTENIIWYEKLQQRDFIYNPCANGLYTNFLRLACDLDNHQEHIMRCIGWLAHDYKDATTAYIIVLIEKCADPKDGGGSGKNLFCELLKHTTTYKSIPVGQKKNIDGTNLLQSWKGERVFALSDAKKDFDFEMLKEPASGNAILKKLFKDEDSLNVHQVPKLIVLTNFSYEVTDGGLRRRIIGIEFTNFFTQCGGVDIHFGKFFPDDFNTDDWADYDNFICNSIRYWIKEGLKLKSIELTETGWEKQFIQTYGQIIFDFIKEYWDEFKNGSFISNSEFNKLFDDFLVENNFNISKFKPTSIKINKALDEWCKKHNYYMTKNEIETTGFRQERGRRFQEEAPF